MSALSLENMAYVEKSLAQWPALPKSMIVIEYHGDGDPAFGGSADDRALGTEGEILPRCGIGQRAVFLTIEDAHQAAKVISNRRPGSVLGVAPTWR